MAANIEMKTVVRNCARNTAHVNGISFQDKNIYPLLREQITGSEPCWSCTDDSNFCFHVLLRNPIAPCEIPNIPALYAQPSGAKQRYCRDAERPHEHRRRSKLTQKIQKREHD